MFDENFQSENNEEHDDAEDYSQLYEEDHHDHAHEDCDFEHEHCDEHDACADDDENNLIINDDDVHCDIEEYPFNDVT